MLSRPNFLRVSSFLWLLAAPLPGAHAAELTAFTHVTVIPMDGERIIDDQTVLVEGDKIAAMGRTGTISIPDGARQVNGTGKFLLPGLSDMHAHIGSHARSEDPARDQALAQNQLLLYAATGVTLLRDPAGSPAHFGYRERLRQGDWIGPDIFFTSPIHEGANPVWDFSTKLTDPEAVEPLVAGYAQAGYQGVKIYHTLSRSVYDAIVDSAHRHGLPVIGHVPFSVGIEYALASGQYSVEHLRGYDFDGVRPEALEIDGGRNAERFGSWMTMTDARMDELIEQTVATRAWNCPTLAVNRYLFDAEAREAIARHPDFHLVHPALRKRIVESERLDAIFSPDSKAALRDALPRQQAFIARLANANGNLLIGTDSIVSAYIPGFTPIDEMLAFADAGLSNYEVLRIATVTAAQSLGVAGSMGTINMGKQANLILVDGNPLSDLQNLRSIHGVMLRGRWLAASELRARLESMADTWESNQRD